jgi:hypothetical protein
MQKILEPRKRSSESLQLFRSREFFLWFSLSLLAPLYFGLITLHHSLSHPYIFSDDAREYIVALQRFSDPQLFPNDPIADYFFKISPVGYKFVYWIFAKVGIQPLLLFKLLPILLASIATIYLFLLFLQIFPSPAGAFISTLVLNQSIWFKDDLVSATPRAFVYPLLAAFLYYLSKRSLIPCSIFLGLQGLFYPQLLLLEWAILTVRLFRWQNKSLQFSQDRTDYLFWLSGSVVTAIALLPFVLNFSQVGDYVTLAQMKQMPEFSAQGRMKYFGVNPIHFLFGGGSGLHFPIYPPTIWLSIGLPFLLRSPSSLVKSKSIEIKLLWDITVASLGMFLLAHLFLFKLYFPSRYISHSFRFVMAISAGIVVSSLLASGWNWLEQKKQAKPNLNQREKFIVRLVCLVLAIAIIAPGIPNFCFRNQNWKIGKIPTIYQFIAAQPKDTLIASLSEQMDSFPTFTQRSILLGREYALPFHPEYYQLIQERAIDLISAQYSSNLSDLEKVIQKYGIDFFLLDKTTFNPDYLLKKDWLIHSLFQEIAIAAANKLKAGVIPALSQSVDRCSIMSTERLNLVDAKCTISR